MVMHSDFPATPEQWVMDHRPQEPVYFFSARQLAQTHAQFTSGFDGEVTYAVKANPERCVLDTLVRAGMTAFDVASPTEMAAVRAAAPDARLHYHNPVRSQAEIDSGRRFGVVSWSVDRMSELDKLGPIEGVEIAVRLKLPVQGAAYDFGTKFGAEPDQAAQLLQVVRARGGLASLTFHPGTQCHDPQAWVSYIDAAYVIAQKAGVTLHRLNVGGGFPAQRDARAPDLAAIFQGIQRAVSDRFGPEAPALVCEPGRGLVASAFQIALCIRAVADGAVFLNDGIYGALSEWRDIGPSDRVRLVPSAPRQTQTRDFRVFGPTCDSLDVLPDPVALPADTREGDYLIFDGIGAYSLALASRFNGYGAARIISTR